MHIRARHSFNKALDDLMKSQLEQRCYAIFLQKGTALIWKNISSVSDSIIQYMVFHCNLLMIFNVYNVLLSKVRGIPLRK